MHDMSNLLKFCRKAIRLELERSKQDNKNLWILHIAKQRYTTQLQLWFIMPEWMNTGLNVEHDDFYARLALVAINRQQQKPFSSSLFVAWRMRLRPEWWNCWMFWRKLQCMYQALFYPVQLILVSDEILNMKHKNYYEYIEHVCISVCLPLY